MLIGPPLWTAAKDIYARFVDDDGLPLAGNIAFRTILSVFPFLIFLTALAGFFGNPELAREVVNYLLETGPEAADRAVGAGDQVNPQPAAQRFPEHRRSADNLDRLGWCR